MKTSRRTKGEGSIIQLTNGKWRARIECEPVDAKRKWLSKTCDTKMEAVKALKVLERKREDNVQSKEFKGNFPKLVDDYLKHTELKGARKSTILRYSYILRFWSELFNHKKVEKITVADINSGIAMLKEKSCTTTLSVGITVLSQVFNFAINCRYISYNPVKLAARPPKSKVKPRYTDYRVITHEEHTIISRYLRKQYDEAFIALKKHTVLARLYVMYNLAYMTGLRVSEVAGLRWSNIDFKAHTLSVKKQLDKDGELVLPKTDNSIRTIDISPELIEILSELKGQYDAQGYDSEFLFPRSASKSKPILAQYIGSTFKRVVMKLKCNKHLTFHSIRHTHATELIENKIPITVVSERLGHSNISITLSIYAHPTSTSRHEAALVCKRIA